MKVAVLLDAEMTFVPWSLVIVALAIALQVYWSKKESKYLGLILPGIVLLCSIIGIFGLVFYDMSGWQIFGQILLFFLTYNIPTLILLAIYKACREKRNKARALEKMSIQDLE